MSGILDAKTRIMDVVITKEGRRQIANGDIRIKFASFTDSHTFYEADIASGSSDASDRIYLEAASLPYDQVTFETDDSGNMIKFEGSNYEFDGDRIFAGAPGSRLKEVTDTAAFASAVDGLLKSSIENFKKLMVIGSRDPMLKNRNFKVSPGSETFKVNTKSPINTAKELSIVNVNSIEPLFLDKRLSHLPNFKFMPPRNDYNGRKLGNFSDLNEGHDLTLRQLKRQLRDKPYVDIDFNATSFENNLIAQFFEIKNKSMTKLDVIDFGEFVQRDGDEFRVFFVGKVFVDDLGSPTFVNLFTLVYGGGAWKTRTQRRRAPPRSLNKIIRDQAEEEGEDL